MELREDSNIRYCHAQKCCLLCSPDEPEDSQTVGLTDPYLWNSLFILKIITARPYALDSFMQRMPLYNYDENS